MAKKPRVKLDNKLIEAFVNATDTFVNAIFSFLFGEVLFTLLPLGITLFIRKLLGASLETLLNTPEWAFTTVVLFGLLITRTIQLKARIQKDTSFRLDVLTRTFAILLIASVICMSLIVMSDQGIEIDSKILMIVQFVLFGLAILFLFTVHLAKESRTYKRDRLNSPISRTRYYKYLVEALEETDRTMTYVVYALRSSHSITAPTADEFRTSNERRISKEKDIQNLLAKVCESAAVAQKGFAHLVDKTAVTEEGAT